MWIRGAGGREFSVRVPQARDQDLVAAEGDAAHVAILESGDAWLLLGNRDTIFVPAGKMTSDFPAARVVE